jgi:hypothetical protein
MKTKQKRAPIASFASVKRAERVVARLTTKEPGRHFHVLRHPKARDAYAVGIMAAGLLLVGYVPQTGYKPGSTGVSPQ